MTATDDKPAFEFTHMEECVVVHIHRLPTLSEARKIKAEFERVQISGVKMIAHLDADTPEAVRKLAKRYQFVFRYSNQRHEVWSC